MKFIIAFLALLCTASATQAQHCQPGEHVAPQAGQFHLVFFAVWTGLVVDQLVDGGKIVATYAIDLHKAAKAGKVERYTGKGTLRVYIKNVDASKMSAELPYLGGPQICRGMARVEKGNDWFEVVIPIDGSDLAQASLVIPVQALTTVKQDAVVCVEPSMPLAYAPAIIAGTFKGRPNMLCDLPGSAPGKTQVGEEVQSGGRGKIFPLIIRRAK